MKKLEALPNRPENAAMNSLIEAHNETVDAVEAIQATLSTPIAPEGAPAPSPEPAPVN